MDLKTSRWIVGAVDLGRKRGGAKSLGQEGTDPQTLLLGRKKGRQWNRASDSIGRALHKGG